MTLVFDMDLLHLNAGFCNGMGWGALALGGFGVWRAIGGLSVLVSGAAVAIPIDGVV